jgi:uncharacterized protein YjbI with pentapeptide repeats
MTTTTLDVLRKLRSTDNQRVLRAIDDLRTRGWLFDGSLTNMAFCHAQMQHADLLGANLTNVDLHQANLESANLSQANLTGARLSRANLRCADFSQAIIVSADFFKADLQGARNLTDDQFLQAKRLWGALMPDGTTYDGRYNLAGDIDFARWGRVRVTDPQAMAEFLQIPLEAYLHGQDLGAKLTMKEPA